MATTTALMRSREHIERLCRMAADETSFRPAVLGELRRAIGFDAHVWLMTDPVTCVGSAPRWPKSPACLYSRQQSG